MNRKLDNLIREWARQAEPTDAQLERLTQAVTGKLRYIQRGDEAGTSRGAFSRRMLAPVGYAAIGAVAAVLVCLFSLQWINRTGVSGSVSTALASISPRELVASARVFSEAAQLFDGRLRWLAETNGDVSMGIESGAEGGVEDSTPYFIRVMVLARAVGQDTWHPFWKTDVIARGQELVEIAVNGRNERNLMLWVYPLDNGQLMVDTDIRFEGNGELSLCKSAVLSAGQPAVVQERTSGGKEYRILQTVTPLANQGDMG